MENLSSKKFNCDFVNQFDGDHSYSNIPRQTPDILYSAVEPTPVKSPKLIAWSEFMSTKLGLKSPTLDDIELLTGNLVTSSMKPYAARYGGHQFGHWVGQLGDGRAITLGEIQDIKNNKWELQLKGSGPTPYSRSADGRAVLRSSVREYLMSESMNFLGIPTTQVLSLTTTGDDVIRDVLYNGNPRPEPGAIVSRLAPSFLRFGNYQILAERAEYDNLNKLVKWTIDRFAPGLTIEQWFDQVCQKTAQMVIDWCRIGFVHGVMNTDNMSILGLTIDYGPFSMLDEFHTDFTPNTTDLPGRRYAFGRQPGICHWNLSQLAMALKPISNNSTLLDDSLDKFKTSLRSRYNDMMSRKLGVEIQEVHSFEFLVQQLNTTLENHQFDYTLFYQALMQWRQDQDIIHFESACYSKFESSIKDIKSWLKLYQSFDYIELGFMKVSNPHFVLRNYLLYQAIQELESGDDKLFKRLEDALRSPYKVREQHLDLCIKKPLWAFDKVGCSALSCSS